MINNAKAWPFVEAHKILERCKNKDHVIFETGYGPSGLPHIGTFGEVLRTTFVLRAFRQISDKSAKIIAFSDDMDGFRRVPTNVPNQEMLAKYIDMPLTKVPDPFEKYESFAHHNNAMLCQFLDSFGFEYEFKSSTEMYKSGVFNEALKRLLQNYDKIMEIMLPSLREERQKTYSPFLPICPDTGKVLQVKIEEVKTDSSTVVYKNDDGKFVEVSALDGNCKLQWKADWGMRWYAFGVDYEMHGKDLIDSFTLSSKICDTIGGQSPIEFTYELFLDEEGKKISKSKGNGLSMEDWLKYAPSESLAYYMYQTPQRAKKLYFDVIPQAMDEYLDSVAKFPAQAADGDGSKKYENPAFFIHNGSVPNYSGCLRFSMLLNLVQTCGIVDQETVMGFVTKYASQGNVSGDAMEFMKQMASFAIVYYKDFVAGTRVLSIPTEDEKRQLQSLHTALQQLPETQRTADDIQTVIYEVGKLYYDQSDLKTWFKRLYEILFGCDRGPRLGGFVALYGMENFLTMLESHIR